jgi:hypothetical protein
MRASIQAVILTSFLHFAMAQTSLPELNFTVAPDTSFISFSGLPKLKVTHVGTGQSATFQMSWGDFRRYLDVTGLLQGSRKVALDDLAAYKKLTTNREAKIDSLNRLIEAEGWRAENFKTKFEEVKRINETYHTQLNSCIDDMQKLNDQKNKNKAWPFVRGVLWGLVVGSVGGLAAGAAF